MNAHVLDTHGARVGQFARSVPNLGMLGQLTRAVVDIFRSNVWRDYRDGGGTYHFQPGEFDYFLASHSVNARDVARLYLTPEERAELASAMDRQRAGEARYRRSIAEVSEANPFTDLMTLYWERYGWAEHPYPVGKRAIVRAEKGVSLEERARQTRIKRLRQLNNGWRDRLARVIAAAEGFTREELLAASDALKERARTAPKLAQSNKPSAVRMRRSRARKRRNLGVT